MIRAFVLLAAAARSFTPSVTPSGDAVSDTPDVAVDAAVPWGAPGVITALGIADDPSMTDDLLEIFINSARTGSIGGSSDIWVSTRSSVTEAWPPPQNVTALNSSLVETTPRVTRDGLSILFHSDRDGSGDIYLSTRGSRTSPWSTPMPVPGLSTTNAAYAAFAQSNLLRVIICLRNGVPDEGLFVSERMGTTDPWGALVHVSEADDPTGNDCDPVDPHDRALYFSSNRTGDFDVYFARRATPTAPYDPPMAITEVNRPTYGDRDVWVSADERTMVFSSDRSGEARIYMSTR